MGQFNVNSSSKACSKIGRARENVSQVLIPHVLVSSALNESFYFIEPATEAIKHRAHVSSLLHGNDTRVVLLVNPYKEVLVFVVPDSTRVRPVTCHAGTREKRGDWFVKQEVIVDQLLLLGCGHAVQRIIAPRQVTWKLWKRHQIIFTYKQLRTKNARTRLCLLRNDSLCENDIRLPIQ